jgi:hypothetical protein
MAKSITGLIGDLAESLGSKIKEYLKLPYISALITQLRAYNTEDTKEIASWAEHVSTQFNFKAVTQGCA